MNMIRLPLVIVCCISLVTACSSTKNTPGDNASRSGSTHTEGTNSSFSSNTEWLISFQDEITESYLRRHLEVIAHDSLEGRETGTEGLRKAADYLAGRYEELGLAKVGDDRSYFQHYDLAATRNDSVVFEVRSIAEDRVVDRSVASRNSRADFVRSFGGSGSLAGDIVFAGFGVNDPDNGVFHLGETDLTGKWVLVFEDIPGVMDGDTLIDPSINARNRYATVINEKGARGLLMIPGSDIEEFEARAGQESVGFGEAIGMRLAYREQGGAGSSPGYNLIHPELAADILELEGIGELVPYRNELTEDIGTFKAFNTGYALRQESYSTDVTIETKNVVAFLEGADPDVKDEVVVLSSHYDHVGIGQPDSSGDAIYNGADDDGSGTVALLNVGRALVAARENGYAPRRSILLLHVSGEEKGLLGSRYYSDHPIFPIEKTVTNINIDMIGRSDREHEEQGISNYAYIIGGEIISSDLDSLLRLGNDRAGQVQLSKRYNDLQDPNQFYRRSDHWNFGRLGVPFAFFFTGVHEDYHRPSDEVDKIDFEKLQRIVRSIYATTVLVANTDNPPIVDNQEFIRITRVQAR